MSLDIDWSFQLLFSPFEKNYLGLKWFHWWIYWINYKIKKNNYLFHTGLIIQAEVISL